MRIYVGTYAKYNNGNLSGDWLDVEDYSDKEEFLQACAELHKDEEDPELMFQDWEGIPNGMVSESHVSDELFEFAQMDEDDQELLRVYREHVRDDADIEEAREAFHGKTASRADWLAEYFEESGDLSNVPEVLRHHIDWDGVARDFKYDGWCFARHDGEVWVFSPN